MNGITIQPSLLPKTVEVLCRNTYRALVRPNRTYTPLWVDIVFDDDLGREHLNLSGVQFSPKPEALEGVRT